MDRWPWHLSNAKAWPASGTTLKTGLTQLIARAAASGIEVRWNDAPGVRVSSSAFTRRAHVEALTADLTGAEVTIDGGRLAHDDGQWIPDPTRDEVVSRTPGSVDDLRLRADPVTINGLELRAELALEHTPVEWVVVRKDGRLYGTVDEGSDAEKRASGSFRVSMAQDDIAELALSIARSRMKDASRWTAALTALKLAVVPKGEGRFVVTAGGAGKVFFLPMSARVGFDVEVRPDGTITIHRATAASRSLLTKLLLLPLRPQLRELAGKTAHLSDEALAVEDLAVDAADGRLTVAGRVRAS
ncbi:hypothetical protein [Microbacterium karelineae]|uniref:hypothetical protein n=1 Tax=Microbacterium karelineae TaxID=2654283 RepID=UPI0012EAB2DB|nr:hypothetical protein [Microbacterium karelineae]